MSYFVVKSHNVSYLVEQQSNLDLQCTRKILTHKFSPFSFLCLVTLFFFFLYHHYCTYHFLINHFFRFLAYTKNHLFAFFAKAPLLKNGLFHKSKKDMGTSQKYFS